MPVISAYSSSSSYISPSSYRYKSSLSDRRSYATSITSSSSGTTGSSFYRRSSYRYDLPSSSSAYSSSSSYRSTAASDRAADTELSNSLSTLATSSAAEVGSSASNGSSKEASRPSRYSSAYGTYGSRISSRSSDGGRSSLKDRENNCYCAVGGAGSSSSYASGLRNTALSGADIYQKYSVSTFSSRPSIYERIAASRPVEKPQPVVSIASASAALDSSKVKTIPAKDRNSNCINVSAQNNNPTNTSNGTNTLTNTSSSVVNPLLDATNSSPSAAGSSSKPGVKPASASTAACFSSVRSETCAASSCNTITHTTTTTTTTTTPLSSSSSSSALHDSTAGRVRRTAATFQPLAKLLRPPAVPPKLSTYRNQNFLKHECDLVKRELSKSATELAFRKTTTTTSSVTAAPLPPKVKQFLPPVRLPQPKDHEDDDKPQSHHHSHPKPHHHHYNGHQLTATTSIPHQTPSPLPSTATGAAVQNNAAAELKPIDNRQPACASTSSANCFEPVTQKNDTFLFKPSTSCSTTTTTTTPTTTTKPTTMASESLTSTIASYQPPSSASTRTESCTYPTPTNSRSAVAAASAMKSLHITSELEESITQATIKLRPSLNGTAPLTNGGGTSTTAKFIATATPAPAEDLHVTATIRLKPKPSISQHNSTSSSSNNNNNGIDGTSSSGSGNSSSDEQDARYRNGNGAKNNGNNNNNEDDGGQSESDDAEDDKQEVDKDSKRQPAAADEEKGSYLRTGTASKSIHSTSPVGYRSGRDWDSGITSTSSTNNGTSSSGYRSGLKSGYGQEEDSPRSGGSRKEGLCGLWNIGNTCFMNSVIQCLSHTRELTNYLRNQPTTERGTSKDHKILAEYTKLIKDMWSGTTRSVNPSEMKNAFSSKHRMYSGSAQQDAQEFLRFFIDSLHGGLNVSVKREPISKEIEDDDMPNRVKSAMMWDWYSRVENSMIKDLFVGMLRSTLRCSACNNASVTFDPFWDLSLPLPSTNSRGKLLDCMDEFVREEVMDGLDQVYCSKCKARRRCTKSMAIERFPKYLVIHLKRFSETRWSKLTNVIEFPTGERELNLQQYASEDHQGPVNYSLYGISNHMGSTAGGHYIAVCKHPISKEWNEFNDNFVSETSERSLVTSSAYVLFYERA
uniref:ubiquitinyl hydrolase 1 n=1 Tax=Culex pipiens TaxID=7175 RepID=A0A8D8B9X6_CULPI